MFKRLLLILLLLSINSFAIDKRLENHPKANRLYKEFSKTQDHTIAFDLALFYEDTLKDSTNAIYWYKKSYRTGSSRAALNLGQHYESLKKHNDAVEWYKKAYDRSDVKAALSLGLLYKSQKQYSLAVEWYKKAYAQGNMDGANGLGYLHDVVLKDEEKGVLWYKKGAQGGNPDAINNLGRTYHAKGDDTKASAYILAMVNYGYTKKEVLDFLKNNWKIDRVTLEKAYQLQQTLDIPKHYTGGID